MSNWALEFHQAVTASLEPFRAQVHVFDNEVKIQTFGNLPNTRGDRGEVRGFSRASRKRMISKLNRLRWPDVPCYFLTLTYPDQFQTDWKLVKHDLTLLKKRLLRRFPDAGVIWRVELKARKSGTNAGKIAPHFHCFLFTGVQRSTVCRFDPKRGRFVRPRGAPPRVSSVSLHSLRLWVASTWTDLVGMSDPVAHLLHGSDVKPITSRREAQYYITKYMSKDDHEDVLPFGRVWGCFGALDFTPHISYVLSLPQLEELRRLLLEYCQASRPKTAAFLADHPLSLGFALFGFGVRSDVLPDPDPPILHLLNQISDLDLTNRRWAEMLRSTY